MPASTYVPLAGLHGVISVESQPNHDQFWCRIEDFGAHADVEIARLWARIKVEETRVEHEVASLWRRLEEFGATEDAEIASLWRKITRK